MSESTHLKTSTLIMLGLGGMLVALSGSWLPRVIDHYNLIETQCLVKAVELKETQPKREAQILVRVSWRAGENQYETDKKQVWRTYNPQHVTLSVLKTQFQRGNSIPCFYNTAAPNRIYPAKADLQEVAWLIGVCLVGILLMGTGIRRLLRVWRNRSQPSETATQEKRPHLEYTLSERRPNVTRAPIDLSAWKDALEASGLTASSDAGFHYKGTFNAVQVSAQQLPEGGLDLRFSRTDEKAAPANFWVKRRETDDPIAAHRNIWPTFDLALDPHIEITGYHAAQVASFLDAEARTLIRHLVVDERLPLYGGQQELADVDVLQNDQADAEIKVLRDLILWFEGVLEPAGGVQDRLSHMALHDPLPLVRLHRLLLLVKHHPGDMVTNQTLNQATGDEDAAIARMANTLCHPSEPTEGLGMAVIKHFETIFLQDGMPLEMMERWVKTFWELTPARLHPSLTQASLASVQNPLVQLAMDELESITTLDALTEKALIALISNVHSPMRLEAIQVLGRAGTIHARDALLPFTEDQYRHSQIGDAAEAALENIAGREGTPA